jgi:hypothetical protein
MTDDGEPETVDELLEHLECYWGDFAPDGWTPAADDGVFDGVCGKWKRQAKGAIERFVKRRVAMLLEPSVEPDAELTCDPDDYPLF